MLSAPVFGAHAADLAAHRRDRDAERARRLRRRHAVAQLDQDADLGAGQAVAARESLHRERLAHPRLPRTTQHGARAGVRGLERNDRDAGAMRRPRRRVSSLRMPRVAAAVTARGAARRRGRGARAARCRAAAAGAGRRARPRAASLMWTKLRAVEEDDDAVVELVERAGEPVPDRPATRPVARHEAVPMERRGAVAMCEHGRMTRSFPADRSEGRRHRE